MNVKRVVQHDYITLKITQPGQRAGLNLTWSRRGEKVSCVPGLADNGIMKNVLKAMDVKEVYKAGKNLGEYTAAVEKKVSAMSDFSDIASVLIECRG